jgi:hypothetical protein
MAVKWTEWPNKLASSFMMYPYWDYWFENMPSGNPVSCILFFFKSFLDKWKAVNSSLSIPIFL